MDFKWRQEDEQKQSWFGIGGLKNLLSGSCFAQKFRPGKY